MAAVECGKCKKTTTPLDTGSTLRCGYCGQKMRGRGAASLKTGRPFQRAAVGAAVPAPNLFATR